MKNIDVSIVVPLYNEDESLSELHSWIQKVMDEHKFSWEVVFVDDGSKDDSWQVIEKLHDQDPTHVQGVRFGRNYGKSAALNTGFKATRGNVVITMDADLQDSPEEIPELYDMISNQGFDLVSGWKKKRYDPLSKTIPTKLFNGATSKMSGIKLHDFNCGLKAYRSKVIKNIEVYGEMHRYIPVIAKRAGFDKIGEKVVQHQSRKYGVTKFGWDRFINGYLDLLSITFMTKYGKRPMHFFGLLGSSMFFIGFALALYLGIDKYLALLAHEPKRLVVDDPFFFIALTSMIMGTMMFLAGFLGELISRSSSERNQYFIDQTIEAKE